ncbi:hypothetical protein FRC10_007220 [Ceratobasidium sp. 414]|nr:hypothetical protein FRC10_007220 [Ceratobasidium sp. 414]
MRNLSLLSSTLNSIPEGKRVATGIAFDTDSNLTYIAAEKTLPAGGTDIEVWQLPVDEDGIPFATLSSDANAAFDTTQQLVSFAFLAESRQLVIILAGGDIAVLAVDEVPNSSEFEIIGSVEPGIKAVAWNPDESQIVLVNGNDELLIMTKDFDVLFENPLRPSDLGQEKHTALGWGSKQTQFHGSLGKAAAATDPSTTGQGGIDKPSPDDDGRPRISWRGDGSFFAVSSLDPSGSGQAVRRLRFYSSNPPAHLSTSEATPGLEGVLAWRPSGGLIATSQRFGYDGGGIGRPRRHDILFFERNGLRRSEFGIRDATALADAPMVPTAIRPWGYKVKEVLWSTDSAVLALWIERDAGDCDSIEDRTFMWDTCASTSHSDESPGTVAVVDGDTILVTPFKLQNVPPPMASFKLSLSTISSAPSSPPVHLAFSPDSRLLGLLFPNQQIQVWDLGLRTGPKGKIADPRIIWSAPAIVQPSTQEGGPSLIRPRQIALSDSAVLVLGSNQNDQQKDAVQITPIKASPDATSYTLSVPNSGRLIGHAYYQGPHGQIYTFDRSDLTKFTSLSRFCAHAQAISTSLGELLVGLDASGKLISSGISSRMTNGDESNSAHIEVAHNVNSFATTAGFLVFTTTAHEIKFAPIAGLFASELGEKERAGWGVRRVERGSRIICVVPANASVVLQLPRGNLETINPRPLVLSSVKADVERGEFRRAFLACRKHRVDQEILVEFAPVAFAEDPGRFVDQVPEVDYLNLFLTGLGQSKRPQEQIANICDNLRKELERRGFAQYVQSILTAHVVKSPPDVESALQVLHKLRETEPKAVEETVKYIIFLVDADQLFNTALGMYDFALVLMIAQQSQKDPREYLPFLRELRALDTYYQRFRINDYLARRELALENLALAGETRFEEAKLYTEKHQLYLKSLGLWKDRPAEYAALLVLYGERLVEHREFSKAGQAFSLARDSKRAMFAFEKARMWKELFSLAADADISSEDLVDMGYRVAVEEIISSEATDLCSHLSDDVQEMSDQLNRQGQRLLDLKEKKQSDPNNFYGHDDPNLHNVDAMTDASGMMTQFTRYTNALTGTTARRSQKSSKKAARKAGRKGTVDEEEYILTSLVKLVQRLEHVQRFRAIGETAQLLPHLPKLSPDHDAAGRQIVEDTIKFEHQLRTVVDREWPLEQGELDHVPPTIPKPPRPVLPKDPWNASLVGV